MDDLKAILDAAKTMRDAKIAEAKVHPLGSELRLMLACQADGMISVMELIDAALAGKGE